MPFPIALAAGILAGAGAIGSSLINRNTTFKTNKQQFQYNKDLAERAYQQNLELWNQQNAYNSPAAQIMRLRAAGLNPNLMYGNGEAAAGNASDAPQLQYGSYNPAVPFFDNPVGQGVNAALSAAQTNSLIDLQNSQSNLNDANAAKTLKDKEWIDRLNQSLVNERESKTLLQDYMSGNYKALTDQVRANTAKIKVEKSILNKQLSYADRYFQLGNELTAAEIQKVMEETKNQPVIRAKLKTEMSLMFSQMKLLAEQTDLTTVQARAVSTSIDESIKRQDLIIQQGHLTERQADALRGAAARAWIGTISNSVRDIGVGVSSIIKPFGNMGSSSAAGPMYDLFGTPNLSY